MLFETVVHGKRRLLSSHSDMSEEIFFQSSAELPQAVMVPVLVPATWRPRRGTVPSLTCGRVLLESPWLGASGRMPDSSSSCSGFLFSPEGTFLCLFGFLKENQLQAGSLVSVQRLARQEEKSASNKTISLGKKHEVF